MSDPRLVSSWILIWTSLHMPIFFDPDVAIIDPNVADHCIADDMFGRIGTGSCGEAWTGSRGKADLEVRFLWRNLEVR